MHKEEAVGEFFKAGHSVSDMKNPVVTVFFVRNQPASTPGQPDRTTKSMELLGMNTFGVVAKGINQNRRRCSIILGHPLTISSSSSQHLPGRRELAGYFCILNCEVGMSKWDKLLAYSWQPIRCQYQFW